jgi:hypothetical protein
LNHINDKCIEKIRYSLSGVVINHVIDNIENDLVVRNIGEKQIVFKNNSVFLIKQNIKLKSIDKPKSKVLFVENKNSISSLIIL